jgi:7-cyano-7-deazaguanine synthase in queuosine biosynthesis
MVNEILLFSGGVDSTVLLKYFLSTKRKIIVLNCSLQWCTNNIVCSKIQKKQVKKIIKYMKKKYGNFKFIEAAISLPIPMGQAFQFGTDDQWSVFLASTLSRYFNVKKIWHASFTYNWENREKFNLIKPYWLLNMKPFCNFATHFDEGFKDLHVSIPKIFFKGKKIDKLKTKKEAWNYLEPELKKLVRSCQGNKFFCGKCYKCNTWVHHKMTDKNGKVLNLSN